MRPARAAGPLRWHGRTTPRSMNSRQGQIPKYPRRRAHNARVRPRQETYRLQLRVRAWWSSNEVGARRADVEQYNRGQRKRRLLRFRRLDAHWDVEWRQRRGVALAEGTIIRAVAMVMMVVCGVGTGFLAWRVDDDDVVVTVSGAARRATVAFHRRVNEGTDQVGGIGREDQYLSMCFTTPHSVLLVVATACYPPGCHPSRQRAG